MYRAFERLNVVFTYGLVVLTLSALALNLTAYYQDFSQIGTIDFKGISGSLRNGSWSYGVEVTGSHDTAYLVFDVSANFGSMFNWNVKQLFVSLVVEYETQTHVRNEVVVWDKIIVRGENPVINTKNGGTRYMLWDDGNGLRGLKATWRLKWNVIRNVGLVGTYQSPAQQLNFPEEYNRY